MRKAQRIPTIKEPTKPRPLGAADFCYIGAAEAMKYGADGHSGKVAKADLKATVEARSLFENFTDQQMAVALLILMVDLGRRIEAAK